MLPGKDPKHQLQLISSLNIPNTDAASMLMKQMLIETPHARVTAQVALRDHYFTGQGLNPETAIPQPPKPQPDDCHLEDSELMQLLIRETSMQMEET